MSDLHPAVIPLDKGLDLSSSKITAPVGSLLSCNNYEITDAQGLKRVDGFEPYDGQVSPGTVTYYYVRVNGSGTMPIVGDIIVAESNVIASTPSIPSETFRLLTESSDSLTTELSEYITTE